MQLKKTIKHEYKFPIGKPSYGLVFKWDDILELVNSDNKPLPTDIIIDFVKEEVPISRWGVDQDSDIELPMHRWVCIVERSELETDDEYVLRLRNEELILKRQEEKDHLEYLRLKAKYE